MSERRDIAALLQLEAILIDAAGSIDREHELQVGRGLRSGWQGIETNAQQRRNGGKVRVQSHARHA